jgi:hypothetical protein
MLTNREGRSMRSKSDHAWRMAAECAKLAQGADEKDERDFYVRMRDSWITVANRYEFLDAVDEHAGRTASRCRRAIHPSPREPQPGPATRIGFAPRTVTSRPRSPGFPA